MALPDDLLDRPPAEAARLLALARVEGLRTAMAACQDGGEEALHDLRVELRRLRSALRSWAPWLEGSVRRRHRRRLSRLQRATGEARDAEVGAAQVRELASELDAPGREAAAWLAGHLEARARTALRGLEREVLRPLARQLGRLERRLCTYPVAVARGPVARERFAPVLAAQLVAHGAALATALEAVQGAHDAAGAHAARIEGKRLRYLLEPLVGRLPSAAGALAALKRVQDALGVLQDAVALESQVLAARAHCATGRDEAGLDEPGRDTTRREQALAALAQRVAQQRLARAEGLLGAWRQGPGGPALAAAVEALVAEVLAQSHAGLEVERKYLLRALPALPPGTPSVEVEQGYLPGEVLQERLRRVRRGAHVECWRTVKLGRGVARVEVEEACSEALFERLWPLTAGCRVRKRRHVVEQGARRWEVDEFLDRDLVLAEIELGSADEPVHLPP
ncbi:MAG: CHAD domain-containing protein [Planctomycetia bacterium]